MAMAMAMWQKKNISCHDTFKVRGRKLTLSKNITPHRYSSKSDTFVIATSEDHDAPKGCGELVQLTVMGAYLRTRLLHILNCT